MDLIKEYLIGIGFEIDKDSLNSASESMDNAKEKVGDFNKSSSEGFSETSNSLKGLFSIMSSSGSIKRLFPNLSIPLKEITADIKTLKSVYNQFAKSDGDIPKKKDNTNIPKKKEDKEEETGLSTESIVDVGISSNNTLEKVNGLKDGLKGLLSKGGASLKGFSMTAVASFAAIVVGIIALILAIKKLMSYMKELADKDIENEKLSRMLWTTKEDAKEVTQALDLLGASMQDLWLSPTLLKQFNQLRRDAQELRLPPEFQDNIKVVQDLGLEFNRFKQLISTLFQWIGHYILESLAGPLVDVKNDMQDFNSWLIEHIPEIAKVIGTIIGGFLRLLLVVGKVVGVLWTLTAPIRWIFKKLGELKKTVGDLPEEVKKGARIIFAALIFAFSPILLIIALIDDLLTFIRGGESVIGDVLDWIKEKWDDFIEKLIDKFWILRKILNIKDEAKEWWDSYYDSASESLEKLWGKAKEILGDIKEWTTEAIDKGKGWVKDKWNKGKDWIFGDDSDDEDTFDVEVVRNLGNKVINFDKDYGENASGAVTQSYMNNTSKTSNNVENNNKNEVNNNNNIQVYSNDPVQAGNVIDKRLTGITARNLQGVINP